nr:MAG TPA: hypothetical protein [Caudoviricetes sp.]
MVAEFCTKLTSKLIVAHREGENIFRSLFFLCVFFQRKEKYHGL